VVGVSVIVKQEEGLEVPAEIFAKAIVKISDGLEGWRRAGMKRHALITLLVASTKVCKRDVELVLLGIDGLKNTYCLPPAHSEKVKK
jgi:hypothetical protein